MQYVADFFANVVIYVPTGLLDTRFQMVLVVHSGLPLAA